MQSEARVILISIPCTYKSCVNLQLRTTSLFRFSLKDWAASRIKQARKVNKTTAVSLRTVTTGNYIVKWSNENEELKATKSYPRELRSTFAPATELLLASLVHSLWTSHFNFTRRTLKQWSPEQWGWFVEIWRSTQLKFEYTQLQAESCALGSDTYSGNPVLCITDWAPKVLNTFDVHSSVPRFSEK